jgi:TolB-like protein/Tfp pilus assembly protein PilF
MGLLSEFKRRNVFRMAALYIVAAWLILQVAGVLIDLTVLPGWAGRIVLLLLTIGFPIALILAWFYEITPGGIALEKDVEAGTSIARASGRRADFVVISLLCAAILMFSYDKWWTSGPSVTSLAVLPFISLGADPELGYLADVMTVELGNELGRIGALSIRSRSSTSRYKEPDRALPQIARDLQVDAVVEGSIQYLEDELRISLQLVDGRADQRLWSEVFHSDLGDLLTIQGEVARAIANQIEVKLTPETEAQLARDRRTSPQAIKHLAIGNHYLKGLDPGSFQKALREFNEAVKQDPEFADAYAGIAHAHLFLGGWHGSEELRKVLPLARSAANKAIHLDPDLAAAHFSLGEIHRFEWNWDKAERAFIDGRRLNPSDPIGLLEFSNFLTALGRTKEAIEVAKAGVEIDPLSPVVRNELGFAYFVDGQNDAALVHYLDALELDPEFLQTHWCLAELYIQTGRLEQAIPHVEAQAKTADTQSWVVYGLLGLQYARVGYRDEAKEILSLLVERAESEYVPAIAFAYLYLGLDERDEVLTWLEAAYDQHDLSMVWLKEDGRYDNLRDDARFQDLLARMHFPE